MRIARCMVQHCCVLCGIKITMHHSPAPKLQPKALQSAAAQRARVVSCIVDYGHSSIQQDSSTGYCVYSGRRESRFMFIQ